MIQRVQSIFLAIVAICMGVVANTSIWTKVNAANSAETVNLSAFSINHVKASGTDSSTTIFILIFAIIAGLIAIYSLSQFKNRKLQMLLGAINSMVIALTVGTMFYYIFKVGNEMIANPAEGTYGIGFYAGGVALLANMISNRFIRRDENLVRSADRMR
jgi:ABC-type antimicrobial peptide transport system permease subunit